MKVAWLPSTSGIVTEKKKNFMVVNNVSFLLVSCDFNSSIYLLPKVHNLAPKHEAKSLLVFFLNVECFKFSLSSLYR